MVYEQVGRIIERKCERMKLDVQPFIENLRNSLDLTEQKRLLIVHVAGNPASEFYVKSKLKEAEKWNVHCYEARFNEDITTEQLEAYIMMESWKNVPFQWDGIIVQLPLPSHINEQEILDIIPKELNVDGFEQSHTKEQLYTPCTALGIVEYLKSITNLEGKNVTLIGRGKTVGKPLIPLLLKENTTLTICHSRTNPSSLESHLNSADIVISAIGKPQYIKPFDLSKGTMKKKIVIDAGISRVDGKQVGDLKHDDYLDTVDYTPWTNGVGKLTVAMLMYNVRKDIGGVK